MNTPVYTIKNQHDYYYKGDPANTCDKHVPLARKDDKDPFFVVGQLYKIILHERFINYFPTLNYFGYLTELPYLRFKMRPTRTSLVYKRSWFGSNEQKHTLQSLKQLDNLDEIARSIDPREYDTAYKDFAGPEYLSDSPVEAVFVLHPLEFKYEDSLFGETLFYENQYNTFYVSGIKSNNDIQAIERVTEEEAISYIKHAICYLNRFDGRKISHGIYKQTVPHDKKLKYALNEEDSRRFINEASSQSRVIHDRQRQGGKRTRKKKKKIKKYKLLYV